MVDTNQLARDVDVRVSDDALKKAEEYVEQEEGAAQQAARRARNLRHRSRGDHVGVPSVRGVRHHADARAARHPCRVRAVPVLSPVSGREALSQSRPLVGLDCRADFAGHHRLHAGGRRRVPRARDQPRRVGRSPRDRADPAGAGSRAAQLRLDHAGDLRRVPGLRDGRPVPAGAVDALRHGREPHRRSHVHDPRRHLRRPDRRVVVADHPVHDLRRGPAVFGRREVLHRLLVRGDGRQADRRGADRGAGLVPARRTVRQRRCNHGDAGHRRLSDAGEGGLRPQCRRRIARRGRPGRDPFAAGARGGRLPDRPVPQHLVSRRHPDGDDSDAALLLRAVPDGRDRRAQVRHAQRRHRRARDDRRAHAPVLVPLPVAGRDHRVHGDRILVDRLRVLGDRGRVRCSAFCTSIARSFRTTCCAAGRRSGADCGIPGW